MRVAPVLATLWVVMFVASAQFLLIAPVLPRIATALVVPEEVLGTLVSGYAVAVGVVATISGPISDKLGRRAMLRVGSTLMVGALLLHGFADSYGALLALRLLAGTASGVLSGAAIAFVGDVIPYERRGRALGIVMSAFAFGQIAGIPLGTIIAARTTFQTPFVLFGVLMIPAALMTFVALPFAESTNPRPLTITSAIQGYAALLRRPDILAINVASTTMMVGVSAYIIYQPRWLERDFAATTEQIAGLFLIGGIANAIAGPIAGWASDIIGRKGMVVVSSAAIALMMLITPLAPTLTWIAVLFFTTMAFVGMRFSPLNALMTAMVGGDQRGSLMSLSMATGQLGSAIGAGLAGWLFVHYGFVANATLAAAFGLLTAAILARWVPEPDGTLGGAPPPQGQAKPADEVP